MTKIKDELDRILIAAFAPVDMELVNESHMHAGPAGRETHFKVSLISSVFNDLNRVKRHQLVYKSVNHLIGNPIHALSLHLYSPKEIDSLPNKDSPPCLGGSHS